MNSLKAKSQFPVFQTPLDLAHFYWGKILKKGDWALDATCGNGKDTLKLMRLIDCGGVIGVDIQKKALENTKSLLNKYLFLENFYLFHQSHQSFPEIAKTKCIRLVVYNLGYLPGGDKSLTTMASSTLESLEAALEILSPGGAISLICYPGHKEGLKEQEALCEYTSRLYPEKWSICYHFWNNRNHSPSFIFIQKSI